MLAPPIKRIVEVSLEAEMDEHLEGNTVKNRRNGRKGKQVQTAFGRVEIETPRDCQSSFEPQIIAKRQTTLNEALNHKAISLYSHGMSYADICTHLEELYGLTVSPATLSKITDSVIAEVEADLCSNVYCFWQTYGTTRNMMVLLINMP